MTSTTNTAGLEVVAWRWHVRGELHWVFCDKKPNFAVSQPGNVCGLEPLVTAASAQARIAELEGVLASLTRRRDDLLATTNADQARYRAAEARADRLAGVLSDAEARLLPFSVRCEMAVRPDDADGSGVTVRTEHLRAARAYFTDAALQQEPTT